VWILGALFVALQMVEFKNAAALGITLQSGPYGAVFYALVACHALHVLGGLVFLALLWQARQPPVAPDAAERAGYTELYWHFVTGMWLVLFSILYIL
jgi:heme/copper-type cytochrome/quinol oxidase subunit 3